MQIRKYILGELLFLANSRPPFWRDTFYRMKDQILARFGTNDGIHLQHVVKHCYECNGTGKRTEEVKHLGQLMLLSAGKCHRCTNGIFNEFWTVLASYQLGRRRFHSPRQRYHSRAEVPAVQFDKTIEGLIRHEASKYYLYAEAAYWLILFFDPKFFWQRFGRSGYPSHKFTPMVILSTWIFEFSMLRRRAQGFRDRLMDKIIRVQQRLCRHEFSDEPHPWERCAKCDIPYLYATAPEEEFPF